MSPRGLNFMSLRNNKFLVSVCVFSLVSNLGTSISFAMKEKRSIDENECSEESNSENENSQKQDCVDVDENKMEKKLHEYNSDKLIDISEEKHDVEKSSKSDVESEKEVEKEMLNFLGFSGVSSFDLHNPGCNSAEQLFTKENEVLNKISKKYEEDKGCKSEPKYDKMKKDGKLFSQEIFFEDEFKKNLGKNKRKETSNHQKNKHGKSSFVTPQKESYIFKVNGSSQYKSGIFLKNGNYSKDSKDKSPCTKFSNNKMEYYTTINKDNTSNNNGYRSKGNKIKFNLKDTFANLEKEKCGSKKLVEVNNGNENFYDHLRKIFEEHPQYKGAVPVIVVGVMVFKEAFDL